MSNKSLVYLTSLQWMAAMLCGPAGLCAQSRVEEVSGREHGHAQTQHPCTGEETAAVLGRLFNKGLATPTFVQVGTNACSLASFSVTSKTYRSTCVHTTVSTKTMRMRFHSDPLSKAFLH